MAKALALVAGATARRALGRGEKIVYGREKTGDDEPAFKGQWPERLLMRIRFSDRNS